MHDGSAPTALQKLPGRETTPPPTPSVCSTGAPRKEFAIAAIETPLPMLAQSKGKLYVLEADKSAVRSGARPPEPLVLHVNVGDCLLIRLRNETAAPVSLHADMLAKDPKDSLGVSAGVNPSQVIAPDQTRTYTYFAHPDLGETAVLVRDWGNVVENPGLGLYGAIIVGPRGATYSHPVTGEDMSLKAGWRVDVHPPSGRSYRDFALLIQDHDEVIGTALMPYNEHVKGVVGLNYRAEPVQGRRAEDPRISTPLLETFAGDRARIHVVVPFSEQSHVFSLEGHRWPLEPDRPGTLMLSSVKVGAMEALTLKVEAGGESASAGDYLYGDHREPYREAGLWGVFRVHEPGAQGVSIRPLPTQ